MRNNIVTKSMLRQRVRTALLLLLLTAAAFVFVMRATEYIAVTDKIGSIAEFYRSVGFLHYTGGHGIPMVADDVFVGAEILRSSPFIEFHDRRRGIGGTLRGMYNTDMVYGEVHGAGGYDLHKNLNERYRWLHTDAFFYAELLSKAFVGRVGTRGSQDYYTRMVFQVDYVLHGYPEFVIEGQQIEVRYLIPGGEAGNPAAIAMAINTMEIGGRYFIRAALYYNRLLAQPQQGISDIALTLVPLNLEIDLTHRHLPGEPLWYIAVESGEHIDASTPGLERLDDIIAALRHRQSSISLRTTADMSALPLAQYGVSAAFVDFMGAVQAAPRPLYLVSGRFIDREDYLSASHVAVVHEWFAYIRGLELGDTFTADITQEQIMIFGYGMFGPNYSAEFLMVNNPHGAYAHGLELTIVGLFRTDIDGSMGTPLVFATSYVYIPDSILPHDFVFLAEPNLLEGAQQRVATWHMERPFAEARYQTIRDFAANQDFLPNVWYSFVLSDPRDEAEFLRTYQDRLSALGFTIIIIEQGAEAFWNSAVPILQAVRFNAVLFSAVLILALALVAFLYLRQRSKEFAIMRILGVPAKIAAKQLLMPILFFGLPTVLVGGAGGWLFALDRAAATINPFGEIASHHPIDLDLSLSAIWLFALAAFVLVAQLAMTLFGVVRAGRRPVLELLQGTTASAARSSAGASARRPQNQITRPLNPPVPSGRILVPAVAATGDSGIMVRRKPRDALRFVYRHIVRAKAKSALVMIVSLAFVFGLGFLHESINRVEAELGYMYDNFVVNAEIRIRATPPRERRYGGMIRAGAVKDVLNKEFTRNEYVQSNYIWARISVSGEDADWFICLEYWNDWDATEYDADGNIVPAQMIGTTNVNAIMGFNDLDKFLALHTTDVADHIGAAWLDEFAVFGGGTDWEAVAQVQREDMRIEFKPGFDEAAFAYAPGEPPPVVLSMPTMHMYGLSLGDTICFCIFDGLNSRFSHSQAVVVGTHNGGTFNLTFRDAILLPLEALQSFFAQSVMMEFSYSTLNFEIDPLWNRDLFTVREELQDVLNQPDAGWVPLSLVLHDDELRAVVGAMEQNLSLLQMLYPVAVAVSVIIGAALMLLLMLQNAKNAATMRVLGTTKAQTHTILRAEQWILCLGGLAIGLFAIVIAGWDAGESALLAGLYLVGVVVGSVVGSVMITDKPPLELLQVKE